ncbi:MAG: DUF480 domain-containing protein, partial [Thiobacillus sp.]|nr:DUF480 domain-containing protein [Thiobacillus sp.]
HLLCGEPVVSSQPVEAGRSDLEARVARLEAEVAELRAALGLVARNGDD